MIDPTTYRTAMTEIAKSLGYGDELDTANLIDRLEEKGEPDAEQAREIANAKQELRALRTARRAKEREDRHFFKKSYELQLQMHQADREGRLAAKVDLARSLLALTQDYPRAGKYAVESARKVLHKAEDRLASEGGQ